MSKIAMIAPFGLKTKGTVRARILPLAAGLVERGHQVRLIVPPWDDPPSSHTSNPSPETIEGVEVVYTALQPKPLVASLPVRLVQTALDFRPAIIHVFKPKAYSGLAASLLVLRRHRFVLDTDDWEGVGGWNDVNPYSLPQKKLFAWQERHLPQQAHAVTVASRTLQNQVWGLGVKPEKVLYLSNGVSPSTYAAWHAPEVSQQAAQWRKRLQLVDKHVLLVYTRFAEFKAERLIKLFSLILQALPPEIATNTRLLVVGGGFFQEEQQLPNLAAPFGIADKIIATGLVGWEDLPALLSLGDISLYPFDDNLINRARSSVKFLELLLMQRPIITEAVGELCEYLREGEGGHLVTPDDAPAFAQAVATLVQADPAYRTEMGAKGAKRLWGEYNWQKLAGNLETFYNQISF